MATARTLGALGLAATNFLQRMHTATQTCPALYTNKCAGKFDGIVAGRDEGATNRLHSREAGLATEESRGFAVMNPVLLRRFGTRC